MRWDETKVGDIVRVPKGTRRGPTTFRVHSVHKDPFREGFTMLRGVTEYSPRGWVYFVKSNGFKGFSVKGDPEFVNGEDE